ncbi:plant invertase/pectin methylesterase inhibitor family protein, partial [Ralstonia pseudosolanacearum]|uniref:plant invertase/pectin methylesterase inhibitor family protein n=1 Tax=Ralstonia pseudosolanacearum TaxID=1310165 RepID=UPI003CF2D389
MEALGPVAKKDGNASPMELVSAVFKATMEEVQKAVKKSSSLHKAAKNAYDRLSLEGCQDMMDCALLELEAAINKLKDGETETIDELIDDLNTLLSAVLSDANICVEDLENPELKKTMQALLEKTEELTINGLAIVEEVGLVLS